MRIESILNALCDSILNSARFVKSGQRIESPFCEIFRVPRHGNLLSVELGFGDNSLRDQNHRVKGVETEDKQIV